MLEEPLRQTEELRQKDEQRELAELRKLIGNDDLERLRPTSGRGGVSFPGLSQNPAMVPRPTVEAPTKDRLQDEEATWDGRAYRPMDNATYARRERIASARAVHAPFVSKKSVLEGFKKDIANHTAMWRQQRAFDREDMQEYKEQREWQHKQQLEWQMRHAVPPRVAARMELEEAKAAEGDSVFLGGPSAVSRGGGKASFQDEAGVVNDAPKAARRRGGASQTSRAHERSRPVARQNTSRNSQARPWAPTAGWDVSPARATPYALRGVKPVTNEPWARDEAINRPGDESDIVQMGAAAKPGAKRMPKKAKPPSSIVEARPAWDGSKTTHYSGY